MRSPHPAAMLAFFAEVERRENERKSAAAAKAAPYGAPWERAARPILVDIAALAKGRRKAAA